MGQRSREKKLRRAERERQLSARQAAIRELGFEVTTEALQEIERFPPDLEVVAEELYAQCHDDPARAIPQLEQFLQKYPQIPMIKNWLAKALSRAGRHEESEAMILRTVRENPEYLFAKLNYAELCLSNDRAHELAGIFGGKTELNEVVPSRAVFHITEFTSFYYVMAKHALMKRDLLALAKHFRKLKRIAPDAEATAVIRTLIEAALIGTMDRVAEAAESPGRRAVESRAMRG